VRIKIYDALGRQVAVLVDGTKTPGVHSAEWNGCNSKGKRVTSGVYFYKIEAGAYTATRKMLVLR
jgi:flagellar hook assembly protein FlgD